MFHLTKLNGSDFVKTDVEKCELSSNYKVPFKVRYPQHVPTTNVKTIPVIASPFEILEYCIALPSLSFLLSLTAQCHIKKATDQMLYEIFNFRQRNTRTEKLKSKKSVAKNPKTENNRKKKPRA